MIRICLYLLVGISSTFSILYLYYRITNSSKKINLAIILFYLIGTAAVILIEYFNVPILNNLVFFLYFPMMFYLLNKMTLKKLFFYVIIVWFYGMLIDIITILVTSLISYGLNFNFYTEYSEFVSMFLTICSSIILIILGYKKFMSKQIKNLYLKVEHIKYVDMLLVIFSVFILGMTFIMFLNVESLNINLLVILVIVLMVLMFAVLIKYKIDEEENIKYLQTLKENNEFYIKMDDENRIFKHNLVAKLMSIKSVSNKKAMILIDDLISQFNKNVAFSKSIKVIPYGLNGIVYQKLYPYLNELNIKVNNEINYDIFNVLKPRRYNVLIEKLIIALDNAIESSLKSNTKVVVINIYDDKNNVYVEIHNCFSNKIDVDSLGSKNYSTKSKRRGLGLFSALRDNEALLTVKIINNMFITKISAKKKLEN